MTGKEEVDRNETMKSLWQNIWIFRSVDRIKFAVDRVLSSDYHSRGIHHCIILLYIEAP